MGYTQGINFIVGYLLTLGCSETDTFWIFINLALNRRYLVLGLFEDGFPLSTIFVGIFKNLLKRKSPQLYTHLYDTLQMGSTICM